MTKALSLQEAVRGVRLGLFGPADALDALVEQALGLVEEFKEDAHEPPAARPRNPFQHPQAASHGYIGPGPKGMIHVPSTLPWHCSGSNYQYMCHRALPDGSTQSKTLNYDPVKVAARNADYRQFAKKRTAAKKANQWPEPLPLEQARALHPVVSFRSHF